MNIFIDTGILIEYLKGNNIEFYEALISGNNKLNINQVVISEYLFHFLAIKAKKSPLSIKTSKKISETFGNLNPFDLIPDFKHLQCNQEIAQLSFELMKKYNLLPNDALILATCKLNTIKYLASYDNNFNEVCKKENIAILCKPQDLLTI